MNRFSSLPKNVATFWHLVVAMALAAAGTASVATTLFKDRALSASPQQSEASSLLGFSPQVASPKVGTSTQTALILDPVGAPINTADITLHFPAEMTNVKIEPLAACGQALSATVNGSVGHLVCRLAVSPQRVAGTPLATIRYTTVKAGTFLMKFTAETKLLKGDAQALRSAEPYVFVAGL